MSKDLMELWASFEILVWDLQYDEKFRLWTIHEKWLHTELPEHTSGHIIEVMVLADRWQMTHHWTYRLTESGQMPGVKSLENHVRQVMNYVTVARWNEGYHDDLTWAVKLHTGNQFGGELEIEHETREKEKA